MECDIGDQYQLFSIPPTFMAIDLSLVGTGFLLHSFSQKIYNRRIEENIEKQINIFSRQFHVRGYALLLLCAILCWRILLYV